MAKKDFFGVEVLVSSNNKHAWTTTVLPQSQVCRQGWHVKICHLTHSSSLNSEKTSPGQSQAGSPGPKPITLGTCGQFRHHTETDSHCFEAALEENFHWDHFWNRAAVTAWGRASLFRVPHHPPHELCAYIEAVKEVILRLLVLHEQLKILKHLQEKKSRNVRHTDQTAQGSTKLYESRTAREPLNCLQGTVMMLDVIPQQAKPHLSLNAMLVLQVSPQQQESWAFNALSSFGSKLQSGDLTALVKLPNRGRHPKATVFSLLSHYYSSPRDLWAISHGLKLQETNPPHCCIV